MPITRRSPLLSLCMLCLVVLTPHGAAAGPGYGFIGLQVQGTMDDRMAEALAIDADAGVLVLDVAPDGPAAAAGVRRGDLIVAVNGNRVRYAGLIRAVQETAPGDRLRLTLRRAGGTVGVTVATTAWKESWYVQERAFASLPGHGLTLTTLTGDVKEKFRDRFALRWGTTGVLVTIVNQEVLGERMSLRPGDVIVQVNQDDVWLPRQVMDKLQAAKADGRGYLLLLVQRPSGFYSILLPVV